MARYEIGEVYEYASKVYVQTSPTEARSATAFEIKRFRELQDVKDRITLKDIGKPGSKATSTKPSTRTPFYNKHFSRYFNKNVRFVNSQGHVTDWAKPMNLRNGKVSNQNWHTVSKRSPETGVVRKLNQNWKFGSYLGKRAKPQIGEGVLNPKTGKTVGRNLGNVLYGSKDWVRHLLISCYEMSKQAERFRIMLGYRAQKVFQKSFRMQKFNSNNAISWTPLAPYTLKKRLARGTGSRILKEYGDLLNSIKVSETARSGLTTVYTDKVVSNKAHHKTLTVCYAGFHNEGKGYYGRFSPHHIPKRYIKRQFIGHSSELNPLTDPFLKQMMRFYLFDSVFLIKKV